MFEFFKTIVKNVSQIRLDGWIPDCIDQRDRQFSSASSSISIKNSVDLRPHCSDIENQRTTGSCVAQATVGSLELLENLQGIPFTDLSRLYVYYNARLAINQANVDKGSRIRDAMASLSSVGVCSEASWPFVISKVNVKPGWSEYREGYIHRLSGYYSITGTGQDRIDQIKKSLSADHGVVFAVSVYENFMPGSPLAPPPSGRLKGGHAMLIVGYDSGTKTFIVRNSWGTDWADGGYFLCKEDWLDQCNCKDVWVPTVTVKF